METVKQENGWVLARNFGLIDTNGLGNNDISRVRQIYEVWSGKEWVKQRFDAKTFTTKDEGDNYVDANWDLLNQA